MPDFTPDLARGKSDAEFLAVATAVVNDLERELGRLPADVRGSARALEIGCGTGRLLRPMSRHFLEIHGFDVSPATVSAARAHLHDIPQAQLHQSQGAGLADLQDESLDFVYSYDFFPRFVQREGVVNFLRETHRVVRPGGFARLEFTGAPGAHLSSQELLEFAQAHDFQVLALEGVSTPSLWTTWRKRERGWSSGLPAELAPAAPVIIRRITNASSFEPVAPCRGRFASIALRVENLPADAGLPHLRATIGNSRGAVTSIAPADRTGWQQVRVDLPELEATGLLPVQLFWQEQPLSEPATLRVIPPGPPIPRVVSAAQRVENRMVKITLEEIARPYEIEISLNGRPVEDLEKICTAPRAQRYEVRFRLPEGLEPGTHPMNVRVGRRKFAPMTIEADA